MGFNMGPRPATTLAAMIAAGAGIYGSGAQAQKAIDKSQTGVVVETIVVTAQRREQDVNDVGIAVTAFSDKMIQSLGIKDSYELTNFTPGLQMVANGGYTGAVNFTLRGVGLNTFAETNEAAVAIYQDEVYIAPLIGSLVGAFDTERIEVLRGPQGTLFGRSASGGLVHYVSKRPTQEPTASVNIQYGSYDERHLEAGIGGPLIDNKLAMRVSGYWNKYDGWLKNIGGPDQYAEERQVGRIQLLLTPSDSVEWLLKAEHGELKNENGYVFLNLAAYRDPADNLVKVLPADLNGNFTVPGGDFNGFRDTDGDFFTGSWGQHDGFLEVKRTLLSSILTWDFGAATLTSVTGYLKVDKESVSKDSASPVALLFVAEDPVEGEEYEQELRLSGSSGRSRWTVGAFYFNYEVFNDLYFPFPIGFPYYGIAPFNPHGVTTLKRESIAGFGQIEYDLTKHFTVIAGLRGEHETGTFSFYQRYDDTPPFDAATAAALLGDPPFVFNPNLNGDDARLDLNYYSGTLELDWRPDEETLVYASLRRGIKPAAFNTPFSTLPSRDMRVEPEQLDAIELGTKLTLLDKRTQLNASVFYYDLKDAQVEFSQGASTLLTNADARIYGLDIEAIADPFTGLTVRLGLNLTEGKLREVGFFAPAGYVRRERTVPNMPKYGVNALARYQWPAFAGTMSVQGDTQFKGAIHHEIQNSPGLRSPAYTVSNARVAWADDLERIEVAAFVKNLFNEEYDVRRNNNVDFGGYIEVLPGKPRWFGIEITRNFGR